MQCRRRDRSVSSSPISSSHSAPIEIALAGFTVLHPTAAYHCGMPGRGARSWTQTGLTLALTHDNNGMIEGFHGRIRLQFGLRKRQTCILDQWKSDGTPILDETF